jgi:cytochrome c peroxidase
MRLFDLPTMRSVTSAVIATTAREGTAARLEDMVVELGFLGKRIGFEQTFLLPNEYEPVRQHGYAWLSDGRVKELTVFANAAFHAAVEAAGGHAFIYPTHIAVFYSRSSGAYHYKIEESEDAKYSEHELKAEYSKVFEKAFGEYRKPSRVRAARRGKCAGGQG